MRTLVSLENLTRDQWRRERMRGIGSSSAASALGISPFKSALQLWCELTGITEPANLDDNESVEWGTILEDPVAEKYHRVTQRNISRPTAIYQHDQYDWMIGNPDRFIEGDPRGLGVLEVKTTGAFRAKDWEDEPPAYYQVQLQHLLAVTGATWGSFAVLIGGQKFRWQDQVRNERFIEFLIEREADFWDMVVRGERPDPDDSESSRRALDLLYPTEQPAKMVALPAEALDWSRELTEAKELIRRGEDMKRHAENNIKAAIGDAEIAVFADGTGYSWKTQERAEYTVKASSVRVFREYKHKKGAVTL